MKILPKIKGHHDLQNLTQQEQAVLCSEIRSFLVDSVSKTGGHLASNLGMVELSVAIETVYNTNTDRLVFDVGHQSYVHKLLTARRILRICVSSAVWQVSPSLPRVQQMLSLQATLPALCPLPWAWQELAA